MLMCFQNAHGHSERTAVRKHDFTNERIPPRANSTHHTGSNFSGMSSSAQRNTNPHSAHVPSSGHCCCHCAKPPRWSYPHRGQRTSFGNADVDSWLETATPESYGTAAGTMNSLPKCILPSISVIASLDGRLQCGSQARSICPMKPARTLFLTSFAAFAAILAGCSHTPAPIVIDGDFTDWESVSALTTDLVDDAAADSFADVQSISATADDRFVHLLVDFGKPVNIQRLVGSAWIVLDVDGDTTTGSEEFGFAGIDVMVRLTPANAHQPDQRGMGIGVASTTYTPSESELVHERSGMISPYKIGFMFGPTYRSQLLEFRIARGTTIQDTPTLFAGEQCTAAIVATALDGLVLDTAGPVTIDLP